MGIHVKYLGPLIRVYIYQFKIHQHLQILMVKIKGPDFDYETGYTGIPFHIGLGGLPILHVSVRAIWTTCPHPALLLRQTMSLLTFELVQEGSHPDVVQAQWFANNWGKFPRISSQLSNGSKTLG